MNLTFLFTVKIHFTQIRIGVTSTPDSKSVILARFTCETDFVAKNKDFLDFCQNCLSQFDITTHGAYNFDKDTQENEQQLNEYLQTQVYDQENKILEAQKLLTSKLGENLGVGQIKSFLGEGNEIFGVYLHRQPARNLGLTGAVVRVDLQDFDSG